MTGDTTNDYSSLAENVDTFAEAPEVSGAGTGDSLTGGVELNGAVGVDGAEGGGGGGDSSDCSAMAGDE